MAILDVKQSGGSYSSLASALSAAGVGDTISIEGEWTVDDTTAAEITDDNITIETDSDSHHNGVYDTAAKHYRLNVSGSDHALTSLGNPGTIEGIAIQYSGSTESAECFRLRPSVGQTATVRKCILYQTGADQYSDCLYTGYNVDIGTVNVEQCVIYKAPRGGVTAQNGLDKEGTININSCVIWGCVNPIRTETTTNQLVLNVHNSILCGWLSGIERFNPGSISYSSSDSSSVTLFDNITSVLENCNPTDNLNPGVGVWVIFKDITTAPYDLRLADDTDNDVIDTHTTATYYGITIPSTDIAGTSRPQNTSYDYGPYEISAGTAHNLTPTGIAIAPVVGTPAFGQTHTLTPTGIAIAPVVGQPVFGQTHTLTPDGIAIAPVVGTPAFGQIYTLNPIGISVAPVVGSPTLGQTHILNPTGITTYPSVGQPTFGQTHILTPTGIAIAPVVGQPVFSSGGQHDLVPLGIEISPVVGTPAFGQTHILTPIGITIAPVVGTPAFGQIHTLIANGITIAPVVGTPDIGQIHILVPTGLTIAPVVGTPDIGQTHTLTPIGITIASVVGRPALNPEIIEGLLVSTFTAYRLDIKFTAYQFDTIFTVITEE